MKICLRKVLWKVRVLLVRMFKQQFSVFFFKIRVGEKLCRITCIVIKNWKHVFKQDYQTAPKSLWLIQVSKIVPCMLLAIIDRKMSYFLIFLQNSVETVPIVTVLLERDGVSFMISLDERLRSGHWFGTRFMIAHTCSSGLNIVLIDTVFANLSIWFLDHIQVALALLEKGIECIFLQIYFFFILLLPTSK